MTENKSIKKTNPAFVIMKRELSAYFQSPMAYIVTSLFLIFSGILFFSPFFLANRAEMRSFFAIMPVTLSFFIPALSMRVFSDERRSGSIETLMTLPVTAFDVVLGKSLSCFASAACMFVPTLFYVLTCYIFGTPDAGPIIGGYLGTLFLVACFTSIGIFASSVTKNQIIAFFIAFAICISLSLVDAFFVFLPAEFLKVFNFISARNHFDSIARGIIDSRDLLYFLSLTVFFFALTVRNLKSERR